MAHHLQHTLRYLQPTERVSRCLANGLESLPQKSCDFGRKKGIAFGVSKDSLNQVRGWFFAADILDQLADMLALQSSQFLPVIRAAAGQLGEGIGQRMRSGHFYIPVGPNNQDLAIWQLADQELQQQEGRLVRPMQIIQHQHQGLGLGKVFE